MQMKIYLIMFVGHDDKQIIKSNQEFLHFHVWSGQENIKDLVTNKSYYLH